MHTFLMQSILAKIFRSTLKYPLYEYGMAIRPMARIMPRRNYGWHKSHGTCFFHFPNMVLPCVTCIIAISSRCMACAPASTSMCLPHTVCLPHLNIIADDQSFIMPFLSPTRNEKIPGEKIDVDSHSALQSPILIFNQLRVLQCSYDNDYVEEYCCLTISALWHQTSI